MTPVTKSDTDDRECSYERLREHMVAPDFPQATVVQILGKAAEDEALDEWVRQQAQAWLNRLVDENGNPKDDFGRDPLEAAAEDNTLNHHGTLTRIYERGGRVTLEVSVSKRARQLERGGVQAKLVKHAIQSVADLLDVLYADEEVTRG